MKNWSSRHYESQHRPSRDYLPKSRSAEFDRPSNTRLPAVGSHASKQYHFRPHHDAYLLSCRTTGLHEVADRNQRIPSFPRKPSRQRMPDIVTSNSVGTSVKKSFGKGYAHTGPSTGSDQGVVDSDELVYADRHERPVDQQGLIEWKEPPRRGTSLGVKETCVTQKSREMAQQRQMKSETVRTYDAPLWQDQEETVPSNKNRNTSVRDKQTARRVASSIKHETVFSTKPASSSCLLQRDRELVPGTDHVQNSSDKKHRKRTHSSDTAEKLLAKFQCKTKVGETSENSRHATSVCVADGQKHVRNEATVAVDEEEKQLPKPKRPAENLTIGTLFDLASYLDEARKSTRRDFDSCSVTVVRQSNEGSRLLHVRPEFNIIESSATLSANEFGDRPVDTSPLLLCHTDTDCAIRLGVLIVETIEQHVDIKKLEQTAKSVSHRLQHGTTKSNEREIICRQRPVLISTVPRTASNIRGKVTSANTDNKCMRKVFRDQQPGGFVAGEYHQKVSPITTVQPLLSSVHSKIREKVPTVSINANSVSSDQQPVSFVASKYPQNVSRISNPIQPLLTFVHSSIRDKVPTATVSTKRMPKISTVRQKVGFVAAKYHPHVSHTSNPVQPLLTSGIGPAVQGTRDISSGPHSRTNSYKSVTSPNISSVGQRTVGCFMPSNPFQSVVSSTDTAVTDSADARTVRRIIIGRKRNTSLNLQPDNLSHHDASIETPKKYNRVESITEQSKSYGASNFSYTMQKTSDLRQKINDRRKRAEKFSSASDFSSCGNWSTGYHGDGHAQ